MSETVQAFLVTGAVEATDETAPAPPQGAPLLDRSGPLFAIFFSVGLVVFVAAFLTVHTQRELTQNPGAARTHRVLSHWLNLAPSGGAVAPSVGPIPVT